MSGGGSSAGARTETVLPTCPRAEQNREIRSIHDSIAIQIRGRDCSTPCAKQYGEIRTINSAVAIDVCRNRWRWELCEHTGKRVRRLWDSRTEVVGLRGTAFALEITAKAVRRVSSWKKRQSPQV